MFFFIVGARRRKRSLDSPRTRIDYCPSCGANRAFVEKGVRNYLDVFFIPILPLGGEKRVFCCESCGHVIGGDGGGVGADGVPSPLTPETPKTLPDVSDIGRDYLHCVHCGSKVGSTRGRGSQRLECPVCKKSFEVYL